jgi:MtN3 and saliva related transmembrane protein
MNTVAIVGGLAAIASMVSFAPQAWKIVRTRRTKDISTGTYSLTVIGFALWLSYGFLLHQWPLIVSNGICLALSAFILCMKLMPPLAKGAVAHALDPQAGDPQVGNPQGDPQAKTPGEG